MRNLCKYLVLTLALAGAVVTGSFAQTITSTGTGNWSSTTPDAPWPGGTVPAATDTVVIAAGHTVTIDINTAACAALTANGYLYFDIVNTGQRLTVSGDVAVGATGRLRSGSGTPAGAKAHELVLQGNLTVTSGGSFDMRVGSSANVSVGRVVFSGSTNSTISLALTVYGSSTEEFNSVIISKSGTAKVILASGNMFLNNNSTNSADTLIFVDGIFETGNNHLVHLGTSSSGVQGASDTSYVNGYLGRGITNTGTPPIMRKFEVGDANGYRPINIEATTQGTSTGHYTWVRVISGNADNSSTFTGDIDRVSGVRYYQVGYEQGAGAATMSYDWFGPSYGADDKVIAGNTDLRVAYSTNARATWNGIPNTIPDTTNLTLPPTSISPDTLSTVVTLTDTTSMYVALARKAGTATNPLAAMTMITHVYPRFTGGTVTSVTALEQPLAFYVEVQNLEPNTVYDQYHTGFLTAGTTSTRGSKWANNAWVSPSTAWTSWITSDASGSIKSWVFVRSPSSYLVGIDTAQLRFRVRKSGSATNLTFDGDRITSLLVKDTAAAAIAGNIVYGYTDTVSQNNTGKFILLYENENDVRPLASWLVYKTPTSLVDSNLYQTRTDSALRRAGSFQMVVPDSTPIGKIEIRDSSNNVLRLQTSTTWKSGAAGDTTNLSAQENIVLSVKQVSDYVPQEFSVSQNYPNPFNPMTTIRFSLKSAGKVSLKVYDMIGREVAVLANDTFAAGSYLVEWKAVGFSSGTYFYVLEAAGMKETRKMVLVK